MGPESDSAARGINAPIYDYYARIFKEKSGITEGLCVDAGSGGGYLGLSLAKITDLDIVFLDISPEALEMARKHTAEDGLENRTKTLLADVHDIPLPDDSVDLVVSRGSLWFWEDPGKAVREIYRILAPGGKAYVGGGKGSPETQKEVEARREKDRGNRGEPQEGNNPPYGIGERMQKQIDYRKVVRDTGIENFDVIKNKDDLYGMWIYMWK
jgi:SAM-dependent methyltransferase